MKWGRNRTANGPEPQRRRSHPAAAVPGITATASHARTSDALNRLLNRYELRVDHGTLDVDLAGFGENAVDKENGSGRDVPRRSHHDRRAICKVERHLLSGCARGRIRLMLQQLAVERGAVDARNAHGDLDALPDGCL